jgi:hypothetical protein
MFLAGAIKFSSDRFPVSPLTQKKAGQLKASYSIKHAANFAVQLIGYFNDIRTLSAGLFMQNATNGDFGPAICMIHGGKIVTTLNQYPPTPPTRKTASRVL